MALIGIGLTTLSLPTLSLGPIKGMVRSLNHKEITSYVNGLLSSDEISLRPKLAAFARDHGLQID